MCLLVVLSRVHPDAPLVVAANRDEWLAREAVAMTVLEERGPRILGGRDLVAGGTWLAVNEHGVVAGLTNRPGARDPAKRSRGELPLLLARHASARAAVDAFAARVRPLDYGPAWLLVGDRESLFFVDVTRGERPLVEELAPGAHVLENRAFRVPSAKVAHVRRRLAGIEEKRGAALVDALAGVLRDHAIPDGAHADDSGVVGFTRPIETEAACVHAGTYGTRSSTIVVVNDRVRTWASDGPPCTNAVAERSF